MYGNYGVYPSYNMPQRYEVNKVNGKQGVDAFALAPNSEVILLDTSAPLIWYVQTDSNGARTATPYTITQYVPEPPLDAGYVNNALRSIMDRLDKLDGGVNNGSKPNLTTDGQAGNGQ